MLSLALAVLLSGAASAQTGGRAEAARLVGRAFEAVAARPRRGVEPETRRSDVERAGHRLLGSGFNVTETAAILALMEDWLRRAPEAKVADASISLDELLERAARGANPDIRDGKGTRGASNWARFVLAVSRPKG